MITSFAFFNSDSMRLGLLLLIGLPSSGKTTLAKTLSENIGNFNIGNDSTYHFIHICYDELIRFPNGKNESEWKSVRNSLLKKIEEFVIALRNKNVNLCPKEFKFHFDSVSSWDSDILLILDDNMYFKSMRYSLFQVARKHNIGFCQIFLKCSLENALLKNSFRGPDTMVPPHVIENMYFKLELPNPKNNWEKYSLELNAFCNLNEIKCKIIPILNKSLSDCFYQNENDFETRELSKAQCKKSVLHQTDIALRKIISFKIKNHLRDYSPESVEFKEYTKGLNSRKSEILSDLKNGTICLPENILEEINADELEKFQLVNFLSSYF